MKKVLLSAGLNFILLFLFGWALMPLYNAQIQFAEIMKDPEPPWELTINILPLLLFVLIGIPISLYFFHKGKKKYKSSWKALMLPSEFAESDEREQWATAKACRNAYVTMWFALPLSAALLVFYPIIQSSFPFYPIVIILLVQALIMMIYYYSLHKNL